MCPIIKLVTPFIHFCVSIQKVLIDFCDNLQTYHFDGFYGSSLIKHTLIVTTAYKIRSRSEEVQFKTFLFYTSQMSLRILDLRYLRFEIITSQVYMLYTLSIRKSTYAINGLEQQAHDIQECNVQATIGIAPCFLARHQYVVVRI